MRSTMDGAGRVVIPKAMRERLGIAGGAAIEIDERDGVVEVRPVPRGVRLAHDDRGRPVLRAPADAPALTDDDVQRALEETRSWPRT